MPTRSRPSTARLRPPAGRSGTCSTTSAAGCCRTRRGSTTRCTWATSCRCRYRWRSGRSPSSRPSPSHAVAELSPPRRRVERRVVRWLADFAVGPDAGGTFTIGATEATFSGLAAARARALPRAWEEGVRGGEACRLLLRARALLRRASGRAARHRREQCRARAVRRTPRDRAGGPRAPARPRTAAVVAVVATSGSTAVGAFDDLDAIGQICATRDIWLHVDGAHGASAPLSPTHRHRMAGVERVRSLAWDPHKMMLMPLAASALLMADEGDLDAGVRPERAVPLPLSRRPTRRPGRAPFQCSRRADALKVWIAWQRYGTEASRPCTTICARRRTPSGAGRRASVVRGDARAGVQHPLLPARRRRDLNARLRPAYTPPARGGSR